MRSIIACLFNLTLHMAVQIVPTLTAVPPSITLRGQLGYGTATY
ncbi:MAG: hypothetical protein ABI700_23900 [Chloroflexota bacterium]